MIIKNNYPAKQIVEKSIFKKFTLPVTHFLQVKKRGGVYAAPPLMLLF